MLATSLGHCRDYEGILLPGRRPEAPSCPGLASPGLPSPVRCSAHLYKVGGWHTDGSAVRTRRGRAHRLLRKPQSASQTCGYPGFLLTAGTLRSWLQGSWARAPTHRLMLWGRPPWPVMDVTVTPALRKYNSHSLPAHRPGASGIRAPSPSPVGLSSEPPDKDP